MSEVIDKQFDEDINPRKKAESVNNEGKSPFSKMSRELTEADLSSPVTVRVLLNQFDEYQSLKGRHEKLLSDYHEKDKKCAILEVERKGSKAFEILNAAMLAVGPLLLGTLPYLISKEEWGALTIIVGIAGLVMLLAGIISKFFVKE